MSADQSRGEDQGSGRDPVVAFNCTHLNKDVVTKKKKKTDCSSGEVAGTQEPGEGMQLPWVMLILQLLHSGVCYHLPSPN